MAKFTTDSKYLTYADISDHDDTVLTIKSYDQEMMGQGKDASEKWVLYFREIKKGLGLNKTNGKMCAKLFDSDEMDHWIGKKIALYVKDDVEFQGEIVSAIRIRSKLPGKLDGIPGVAPTGAFKDISMLDFEGTLYAIDHANSLQEIGQLMSHGLATATEIEKKALLEAKELRINVLMGAA